MANLTARMTDVTKGSVELITPPVFVWGIASKFGLLGPNDIRSGLERIASDKGADTLIWLHVQPDPNDKSIPDIASVEIRSANPDLPYATTCLKEFFQTMPQGLPKDQRTVERYAQGIESTVMMVTGLNHYASHRFRDAKTVLESGTSANADKQIGADQQVTDWVRDYLPAYYFFLVDLRQRLAQAPAGSTSETQIPYTLTEQEMNLVKQILEKNAGRALNYRNPCHAWNALYLARLAQLNGDLQGAERGYASIQDHLQEIQEGHIQSAPGDFEKFVGSLEFHYGRLRLDQAEQARRAASPGQSPGPTRQKDLISEALKRFDCATQCKTYVTAHDKCVPDITDKCQSDDFRLWRALGSAGQQLSQLSSGTPTPTVLRQALDHLNVALDLKPDDGLSVLTSLVIYQLLATCDDTADWAECAERVKDEFCTHPIAVLLNDSPKKVNQTDTIIGIDILSISCGDTSKPRIIFTKGGGPVGPDDTPLGVPVDACKLVGPATEWGQAVSILEPIIVEMWIEYSPSERVPVARLSIMVDPDLQLEIQEGIQVNRVWEPRARIICGTNPQPGFYLPPHFKLYLQVRLWGTKQWRLEEMTEKPGESVGPKGAIYRSALILDQPGDYEARLIIQDETYGSVNPRVVKEGRVERFLVNPRPTPTTTSTPTATQTHTPSATPTPTNTSTPTVTSTPTPSATPTITPTPTYSVRLTRPLLYYPLPQEDGNYQLVVEGQAELTGGQPSLRWITFYDYDDVKQQDLKSLAVEGDEFTESQNACELLSLPDGDSKPEQFWWSGPDGLPLLRRRYTLAFYANWSDPTLAKTPVATRGPVVVEIQPKLILDEPQAGETHIIQPDEVYPLTVELLCDKTPVSFGGSNFASRTKIWVIIEEAPLPADALPRIVKHIELTEQPERSGRYVGEISLEYGSYRLYAELRVGDVKGVRSADQSWVAPTPEPKP